MIYRFEGFELDTDRYELRHGGQPKAVEPQVFALLTMLVENRHRMVPREEIISAVWAGRAVSDSALSSRIKSARQALEDDGDAQRLIRTVHGQVFRLGRGGIRRRTSPGATRADGPCGSGPRGARPAGDRRAAVRERERASGGRLLRGRHRGGAPFRALVVRWFPILSRNSSFDRSRAALRPRRGRRARATP